MKVSELRIGNYVFLHGIIIEMTASDFNFDESYFKPIPLTEEWLLKFGFEKDVDDLILDTDLFLLVSYNDDEFVHLKSNHLETIISIKYVHQLQNLYFALTNEELTYE